jgi:TPP-dependent pyruvate/acetoin dehydrogenase alpha subunit
MYVIEFYNPTTGKVEKITVKGNDYNAFQKLMNKAIEQVKAGK